ncbi:MAG: Hsp20/alpha crystallin family protein [Acidimicrobiales bacterium]|nr:Hsp20/alpha crystallin family protein [Acidimicrobiales bacterium]
MADTTANPETRTDSEGTVLDGGDAGAGPQHIPLNVYETTDAVVIVAPMPGVRDDDVAVSVDEDGCLQLSARLRTAAPKDYLLHEWDYGAYERSYALPAGFAGPVTASLGNGQLAVRVERLGARPTGEPVVVQPAMAGDEH